MSFIPQKFRPKIKGYKTKAKKNSFRVFDKKKSFSEKIIVILSCNESSFKSLFESNNTLVLSIEDIGDFWFYEYFDNTLIFYTKNESCHPLGIYHRLRTLNKPSPCSDAIQYLMCILDVWKGKQIGCNLFNSNNSSKPYQLLTLTKCIFNNKVKVPFTKIIKGEKQLKEIEKDKFIVKSISSIRSIAAESLDYQKWDTSNISNVPCLFQEKILGNDLRIHSLNSRSFWIDKVSKKKKLDYRYDKSSVIKNMKNLSKDVKVFIKKISCLEKLVLVGLDFIKVNHTYFCLECNPSPGWICYHGVRKKEIKKDIIGYLKND